MMTAVHTIALLGSRLIQRLDLLSYRLVGPAKVLSCPNKHPGGAPVTVGIYPHPEQGNALGGALGEDLVELALVLLRDGGVAAQDLAELLSADGLLLDEHLHDVVDGLRNSRELRQGPDLSKGRPYMS